MTTGQIIKMLREEKGMTQDTLAKLMGYSHKSSINKIEMGKADLPQSKLIAFAQVLGVTPCELLGSESTISNDERKEQPSQEHPNHSLPTYGKPNQNSECQPLFPHEVNLILKYRTLDDDGRTMVDCALINEVRRIQGK